MNYALCYVSTAAPNLSSQEINFLLEKSEQRNNACALTGILLYSEGNFFQVLEGEKEQVLHIFEIIKEDSRHYNVLKIFEKPIETIQFDAYYSDFATLNMQKNQKELQPYLKQVEKLNSSIQPSVRYILKQFTDGI